MLRGSVCGRLVGGLKASMKDSCTFSPLSLISFVVLGVSPRTFALDKGFTTGLCHQLRATQKQETQSVEISPKDKITTHASLSL